MMTLAKARDRATLNATEVGQVLGISPDSVYRAAKTGELPTLRLGSRLLFPTAKLLELLGENEPHEAASSAEHRESRPLETDGPPRIPATTPVTRNLQPQRALRAVTR